MPSGTRKTSERQCHHDFERAAVEMAAEQIGQGDRAVDAAGAPDQRIEEIADDKGQKDVAEEPGDGGVPFA